MYRKFYGLAENPFSLLPDPSYLYLSDKHRLALAILEYGLTNPSGICVITGDIGTGKTTIIRHLLNRLDKSVTVGLISNTHESFGGLMQWISLSFGLPCEGQEKVALYSRFQEFVIHQYAQRKRTVLIIDEAQNLAPGALEELRVISNLNADKDFVLQLVLVGQPQLRTTLRSPTLEQFIQRISADFHLKAFAPSDTDAYIQHRLKVAGGDPELFDPLARRFIHHQSGGVPRIINSLCDMSLVYGFAEQSRKIGVETAVAVVRDKVTNGLFGGGKRGAPSVTSIDREDAARLQASLAALRGLAATASAAVPAAGAGPGPAQP